MTAGLGTRLRPFTELRPKPLLPLLGVPLVQFAADALARAGVRKVVANIHHLPELALRGLRAIDWAGASLEIIDESAELLGSAGTHVRARPLFGERPYFLLNGDVVCDADLQELAAAHAGLRARHGVTLTLLVLPEAPPVGEYREIVFDRSTGLMTELGPLSRGRPFFASAAVVEPSALEEVPASGPADFLRTVLLPQLSKSRVGVHIRRARWHDIGDAALWLRTHLELLRELEFGRLDRAWRERIEGACRRVGELAWVGRSAPRMLDRADWIGPCFWAPLAKGDAPPRRLGPGAVVYGGVCPGGSAPGIWFDRQAL